MTFLAAYTAPPTPERHYPDYVNLRQSGDAIKITTRSMADVDGEPVTNVVTVPIDDFMQMMHDVIVKLRT